MTVSAVDIIALILGGLGFGLSLVLGYLSHFRPPRIEMLSGGRLKFYPAPSRGPEGLVWGGVGFYLPITFHNWSTRGGVVHQVRLIVQPVTDPTRSYDMKWAEFAELEDERRWVSKRLAQPLPIDGQTSRTEIVQFQWMPGSEDFLVEASDYSLTILGWSRPGGKPNLVSKATMTISPEQAAGYHRCLREQNPLTLEAPLGEDRQWQRVESQDEANRRYGLRST